MDELKLSVLALGLQEDTNWEAEEGKFSLLMQFQTACQNPLYESSRYNRVFFKLAHEGKAVPLDWLENSEMEKLFGKLNAEIRKLQTTNSPWCTHGHQP